LAKYLPVLYPAVDEALLQQSKFVGRTYSDRAAAEKAVITSANWSRADRKLQPYVVTLSDGATPKAQKIERIEMGRSANPDTPLNAAQVVTRVANSGSLEELAELIRIAGGSVPVSGTGGDIVAELRKVVAPRGNASRFKGSTTKQAKLALMALDRRLAIEAEREPNEGKADKKKDGKTESLFGRKVVGQMKKAGIPHFEGVRDIIKSTVLERKEALKAAREAKPAPPKPPVTAEEKAEREQSKIDREMKRIEAMLPVMSKGSRKAVRKVIEESVTSGKPITDAQAEKVAQEICDDADDDKTGKKAPADGQGPVPIPAEDYNPKGDDHHGQVTSVQRQYSGGDQGTGPTERELKRKEIKELIKISRRTPPKGYSDKERAEKDRITESLQELNKIGTELVPGVTLAVAADTATAYAYSSKTDWKEYVEDLHKGGKVSKSAKKLPKIFYTVRVLEHRLDDFHAAIDTHKNYDTKEQAKTAFDRAKASESTSIAWFTRNERGPSGKSEMVDVYKWVHPDKKKPAKAKKPTKPPKPTSRNTFAVYEQYREHGYVPDRVRANVKTHLERVIAWGGLKKRKAGGWVLTPKGEKLLKAEGYIPDDGLSWPKIVERGFPLTNEPETKSTPKKKPVVIPQTPPPPWKTGIAIAPGVVARPSEKLSEEARDSLVALVGMKGNVGQIGVDIMTDEALELEKAGLLVIDPDDIRMDQPPAEVTAAGVEWAKKLKGKEQKSKPIAKPASDPMDRFEGIVQGIFKKRDGNPSRPMASTGTAGGLPTREEVKRVMRGIMDNEGWWANEGFDINLTYLAEEATRQLEAGGNYENLDATLDDPDHWIWELPVEIAEEAESGQRQNNPQKYTAYRLTRQEHAELDRLLIAADFQRTALLESMLTGQLWTNEDWVIVMTRLESALAYRKDDPDLFNTSVKIPETELLVEYFRTLEPITGKTSQMGFDFNPGRAGNPRKIWHVTKEGGVWKVTRGGSKKASSTHKLKTRAVRAGRKLAKKANGQLMIHKLDGTIQSERTYSNDPYPPSG